MAKREYANEQEATAVAKEALWLAFQAAGGPQGLGFLRDKKGADKEDVWKNAYNGEDYSGVRHSRGIDVHADYVFGRMLKLSICRPTPTCIEVPESQPRGDYQSWCYQYKSYADLFDAAEHAITQTAA